MKLYRYTGEMTEDIQRGLEKLEELFEKVEKNIGVDGIEYIYYHDTYYGYKVLHVLQVSSEEIFIGQSIPVDDKEIVEIPKNKRKKGAIKQFLDKINEIEELKDKIKQEK